MTYTEQQQLTIARAIAYVIERHTGVPGWATESMTGTHLWWCSLCGDVGTHAPGCEDGGHGSLIPWERPITTLADARDQWAASGGDPEKGPALSYEVPALDDKDGRVGWKVYEHEVYIAVGKVHAFVLLSNGRAHIGTDPGRTPAADARLLADIIEAVEGAMPEVTRG